VVDLVQSEVNWESQTTDLILNISCADETSRQRAEIKVSGLNPIAFAETRRFEVKEKTRVYLHEIERTGSWITQVLGPRVLNPNALTITTDRESVKKYEHWVRSMAGTIDSVDGKPCKPGGEKRGE
jgi:hypothetical protein